MNVAERIINQRAVAGLKGRMPPPAESDRPATGRDDDGDGEADLTGYAKGAGAALLRSDNIVAWLLALLLSPFLLAAEAILLSVLAWAWKKRTRARSEDRE